LLIWFAVLAEKNDVFISYAHADIEFTRSLKEELERNCIKWFFFFFFFSFLEPSLVSQILTTSFFFFSFFFSSMMDSWMDEWRLEAGNDWRNQIGEGILQAKTILFVASKRSVEVSQQERSVGRLTLFNSLNGA
jgi:hypothetical protein